MKLALAIILCIGLYLCAANAMFPGTSGGASASQPLLVCDLPEYRKRFLNQHGYKMFLENIYEKYVKIDKNIHERYGKIDKSPEAYSAYAKYADEKYGKFDRNSVKSDDFVKFVNEKCGVVFKNVDEKYETFVEISRSRLILPKDLAKYSIKYNLMNGSFEHLASAEPNFKEECIEKFESELASNPRGFVQYDDQKKKVVMESFIEMGKAAYSVLEDQIKIFVDDLKESGIKPEAQDSLDNCLINRDILRIFGFWFAPNCNENDLKKEIKKMKAKHNLNNDKAAKVMVLLKKFGGAEVDEEYLPETWSHTLASSARKFQKATSILN